MPAPVTTESVWRALSAHMFGVLSWVAPGGARSAGIVYVVRDRKLLIGTDDDSWKARHIRADPRVSVTATFAKRLWFLPWIKIPDATITFRGEARIIESPDVPADLVEDLNRGMAEDPERTAKMCLIEVTPQGDFLTYGIDVSISDMRDPKKAMGRAPC